MKPITPRPILPEELRVLRQTLERASNRAPAASRLAGLELLAVVAVCECGCRSVYFTSVAGADERVANGVGRSEDGNLIEVVVWANEETVTAMDIIDFSSGGRFPVPESIAAL